MNNEHNPTLSAALSYARLGCYVFPVQRNKEPFPGFRWKERASADAASVEALFAQRLTDDVSVAIYVGKSRLVVLDVDPRNGGKASLQALLARVSEETRSAMAAAPRSVTPNRGLHIFFRAPKDSLGNSRTHAFGPGIDVKCGDGYVLVPPSKAVRGDGVLADYEWAAGKSLGDVPIPALPLELIAFLGDRRSALSVQERSFVYASELQSSEQTATVLGDDIPEALRAFVPPNRVVPPRLIEQHFLTGAIFRKGERNDKAFWIACELLGEDWTQRETFDFICALSNNGWFEHSENDPFTHDEVLGRVKSAAANLRQKAQAAVEAEPARPVSASVDGSDVAWRDPRPKPVLDSAALYGLAGELVRAIEHETEACPAALLTTLLVCFGNAVGAGPHARVQGDEHPGRLNVVLVGNTSSGKGTSYATIKPFLRAMDDVWFDACPKSGFGSGESIVTELAGLHRDPKDESPIERRVLVIETELGRLLTVNDREGSTSSQTLRRAWDEAVLESRLAKKSIVARGAHLSILGHITSEELRAKLGSIEIANGFANRCLFIHVERSRKLPSGGNVPAEAVATFGQRLREAIEFARGVCHMERTAKAEELWAKFYNEEPEVGGLVGAITQRAAPQKLRLSVIYALLDHSATIRPEHVVAAEALWRYARATAQYLWGGTLGDPYADRLLDELRAVYPNGLTWTAQSALFGRHAPESRLAAARAQLLAIRLVEERRIKTNGRPTRLLIALPQEKSEESAQTAGFGSLISLISDFSLTAGKKAPVAEKAPAATAVLAQDINDPRPLRVRRTEAEMRALKSEARMGKPASDDGRGAFPTT